MSKTQKIKKHFENGNSLTSWEAIELFRCTRLAAVVSVLKDRGMRFQTEKCSSVNSQGQKSNFVRYTCTNAAGNENQISMFTQDASKFKKWLDQPPTFDEKKHIR